MSELRDSFRGTRRSRQRFRQSLGECVCGRKPMPERELCDCGRRGVNYDPIIAQQFQDALAKSRKP